MFNLSKINLFSKQENTANKQESGEQTIELTEDQVEQIKNDATTIEKLLTEIKSYADQFEITEAARPLAEFVKKYSVPLMIVGFSFVATVEASAQYNLLGQRVGVANPTENINGKREKTDLEKEQNRHMGYDMVGMIGSTMTMSQNENLRNAGVLIQGSAGAAKTVDWRISQTKRQGGRRQ